MLKMYRLFVTVRFAEASSTISVTELVRLLRLKSRFVSNSRNQKGLLKVPFLLFFFIAGDKVEEKQNNVNEANMAVLQPEGVNDSSDINPEMYVDKKPSISEKQFLVAKEEGAMSGFYDWVRCILFAISVVVVCLIFLFRLVDVEGRSMNNTLATNDKVIVTNLFYTPKITISLLFLTVQSITVRLLSVLSLLRDRLLRSIMTTTKS